MRFQWLLSRCGGPKALAAAVALAFTCGCGDSGSQMTQHPSTARPHRIVCGSPAVAEIVFALGCGDRVVGISDYTVYPPEAKEKASIGGWINPNRERLLVLKPDIIVTQGRHETLADFADEYGLRFHAVKLDTLADVYEAIASVAACLGVAERGQALTDDIRRMIGVTSATVATAPPKRVLLLFGRTPGSLTGLGTVGPGTFLDDMIRIAGGTNIFADAKGAYPQVSKEALLVRSPDVILEINPDGLEEKAVALLRADWREFAGLPAVRENRIHYLTNEFLLIPGPRVGQIASVLAKAIHPEVSHE